jgi:hypothetical protein
MFNRNKEKKEKVVGGEQPLVVYEVEYMGGHPLFPEKQWLRVGLFDKYLKLKGEGEGFAIPYEHIKKIEGTTGERVTLGRVILLGLWALALKKKDYYVIVEYTDDVGLDISMVFKFQDYQRDEAIRLIYKKVVEAKLPQSQQKPKTELKPAAETIRPIGGIFGN